MQVVVPPNYWEKEVDQKTVHARDDEEESIHPDTLRHDDDDHDDDGFVTVFEVYLSHSISTPKVQILDGLATAATVVARASRSHGKLTSCMWLSRLCLSHCKPIMFHYSALFLLGRFLTCLILKRLTKMVEP